MSWIVNDDFTYPAGWAPGTDAQARSREACAQLEKGEVLFFNRIPFDFPQDDQEFLLSQKQSAFKGHKNISYRPKTDQLRGADSETPEASQRLQVVMRSFSANITKFLGQFLAPYADKWRMDFASYRPVEEQNRDLSLHKRNDLMHVDAFPSRPTHGGRIMRCFVNINPTRNRVWEVTDPFVVIAKKYAQDAGLPRFAAAAGSAKESLLRTFTPIFKTIGVNGTDRSAYDRFMLHFHDYLKENTDYQTNFPKKHMEFPPGSCWIVYTDTVPHAVLSGQYALEQTYIVPLDAMVTPQVAPIRVLEQMCGKALANN